MTTWPFTDRQRPFDLITMGRVAVDLYAEQIGASLADAQTFRKYLGGCAGNIAVGAARLGLKVSMLSAVGADALGHFLKQTLALEKVDTSQLQVSTHHLTGLVVLGVCPPDHFPLIFFRNDCADMAIDKNLITAQYLQEASALLVTGTGLSHPVTKETTLHAIKLARSTNTKVILDIDYRPVLWGLLPKGDGENRYVAARNVSDEFTNVLPLVDLVVGTEEECRIASGSDDPLDLRTKTDAIIVIKKGSEGAVCHAHKEIVSSPALSTTVHNVLGAGDGFMAGFLASFLRGETIAHSLASGNAAGALVVSRHGCSHACPSQEELAHVKANPHSIGTPTIEQLHERTLLREHDRRAPMPVLAFCHRWQLEEECLRNNVSFDMIAPFKTAVAEAFISATKKHEMKNAFMLCDPHYGKAALALEQRAIVAIEKSGAQLTQWVSDESAYEILLTRPPTWGVKLSWHFHEDMADREHQLTRLKELARACSKLDRKLMLELIVPRGSEHDREIARSVARVYREGVFPYWWKLPALKTRAAFTHLAQTIDEFDTHARVLTLGGDAKELDDYETDFAIAQSTHHGIGFAIGRSIFWPSFCGYVRGALKLTDVQQEVAARFAHLYQLWLTAAPQQE